jgi:hypothetical protein
MAFNVFEIMQAEKHILTYPKWVVRDGQKVELSAPLAIDGVLLEGLELRLTALLDFPNRDVCFNLLCQPPAGRKIPISRLEWNTMRPHTNRLVGPKNLHGLTFRGTHLHSLDDNWDFTNDSFLDGNLPVARNLEKNPENFLDLLECVANLFNIRNLERLEPPSWTEGTLF